MCYNYSIKMTNFITIGTIVSFIQDNPPFHDIVGVGMFKSMSLKDVFHIPLPNFFINYISPMKLYLPSLVDPNGHLIFG